MNLSDPFVIAVLGLMTLAAAVTAGVLLMRTARARARASRRVVERPNSHYTSQLVRNAETRTAWHGIPLDRIHEINREEVVRLLAKVDALGVPSLRNDERTFLDRMAELTGVKPPQHGDVNG
jgi:hypothetical protein